MLFSLLYLIIFLTLIFIIIHFVIALRLLSKQMNAQQPPSSSAYIISLVLAKSQMIFPDCAR